MSIDEQWREAVGYEGRYRVSNLGRVYSIDNGHPSTGRILRAAPNKRGYPRVCLTAADGSRRSVFVHTLVCTTFHGPNPGGMEVRHGDGTRRNHESNLRWGTHQENTEDGIAHGAFKPPTDLLTDEQIGEIVSSDLTARQIGDHYGISKSYARLLYRRDTPRARRMWIKGQDLSRNPTCRGLTK